MSSIIDRVTSLGVPLDQIVVIGSGLLDALGIRQSTDVDLAVSDTLFETLRASGRYDVEERATGTVLLKDDIEVWRDWWVDYPYELLVADAHIIKGVPFASLETIIEHKKQHGRDKDIRDIQLIEEYLRERQ